MTFNDCRVLLSLGSNVGSRREWIEEALWLLAGEGIQLQRCSSFYETEPVGIVDQPDFLNIGCEVRTALEPRHLLERCLKTELELGRMRNGIKGPRNIDIDIIFFGDEIISEEGLSIPHPEAQLRRFVLEPLVEIAPDFRDPRTGSTLDRLLVACPDASAVVRCAPFSDGPVQQTALSGVLEESEQQIG